MSNFIIINDKRFKTVLAISEKEQEQGLMYVDWPPPVMSFIYASPRINKFWMKNTKCPLDIVFCYKNKITNILQGEPYSTKVIGDNYFSDLVVELPVGTCKASNIKIGDSVKLEVSEDTMNKLSAWKKY